MYFTEGNAQKIGAIRSQIREWRSREDINQSEERVLIADLGHVDKWRSQRRIDVMSMKPRKLSAVLS